MLDIFFDFEKSIENLLNIEHKMNVIIEDYEPKTDIEYNDKNNIDRYFKQNKILSDWFDLHLDTTGKLYKKTSSSRIK